MVVEVENPVNKSMHSGDKPPVSVIEAANKLPNRVLYTNTDANRVYNELQYDIFQTQKEHDRALNSPKKKKGIIVAALFAGVVVTGIIFRKNISNFFKNIFARFSN